MKKSIVSILFIVALSGVVLTGCKDDTATIPATTTEVSEVEDESIPEETEEILSDTSEEVETEDVANTDEVNESFDELTDGETTISLEDGVYTAEFNTDSGMFHANEACDGKGTLTVENGVMTFHVSLVSKKIKNLYVGLADDAQKDGAVLLDPTVDEVTYSDGTTEEVFGFDIPVNAINTEFDLALIGEKDKWYDHKVSIDNPEKQ